MATVPLVEPRRATFKADAAFERLYRRYANEVYRYALAVMRNPSDAEDVVQTTFMNAYRAMREGIQPLKPQHWLIKIAHNTCRTRFQRNGRRPQEVPFEDALAEVPVPEDERPNVHAVLQALGRLPFNQRAALVMRELEGRSYEEIAETLGISVSAVETLLFRARRSLKMRASALRALGAVQMPASLQALFGGGGAVATGGTLLGGGLAAKAVALLVAGVVVGGVGYKAVDATVVRPPHVSKGDLTDKPRAASFASVRPRPGAGVAPSPAAPSLGIAGSRIPAKPADDTAAPRERARAVSEAVTVASATPAAAAVQQASSPAPAASSPASSVTSTVTSVTSTVANATPSLPAVTTPAVPQVPVQTTPQLPVTPPQLPVTPPQVPTVSTPPLPATPTVPLP